MHKNNIHPAYRPDIDGLRAIAVLSVVIFHAFPSLLRGGFVGVDIFFVISGYLISTIIFRSLAQNDFGFWDFYGRRVRRIFPALIVVLGASFLFGWFALMPDEFQQLGKHMAAGAAFVQNFVLWKEAGYFDTASEFKPLMHLWSLAVEEQFYLIYPMLVWAAWRTRLNLLYVVALLALLSFATNIVEVKADPVGAFFFPQTRFWELLSGAVLAYLHATPPAKPAEADLGNKAARSSVMLSDRRRTMLSVIGMLLIGFSIVFINDRMALPGWWATAPVAGAVLLIASGPTAWANRVVLSSKALVWIGLISYPLYLWHWPLLSLSRIVESGFPSREMRGVAVLLSIGLAWGTYRFVERPIRFGGGLARVLSLCGAVAAVGIVGITTVQLHGFEARSSIQAYIANQKDVLWQPDKLGYRACDESINSNPALNYCLYSKGTSPEYVVFGDSHADHLFYGLARQSPAAWMLIGNSGCPPVAKIQVQGDFKDCEMRSERALEFIANSPSVKTVVLSLATYLADTPYAADHVAAKFGPEAIKISSNATALTNRADLLYFGLSAAVERLQAAGKSVVLVADDPELPFFPKSCIGRPFASAKNDCTLSRESVMQRQTQQRNVIFRVAEHHPGVRVFDTLSQLCDGQTCHAKIDGVLLYRDSHHLSMRGSEFIARSLWPWLLETSK